MSVTPDAAPAAAPPTASVRAGVRRGMAAAAGVFIAVMLAHTWMYSDITVPNERSRVYLAVALVDHGRLDIDAPIARFGPVHDQAIRDGRHYTDKAPGASLLAAIPYAVARVFSEPEDWTLFDLLQLERRALMIPLSLLGVLLLWRILTGLGVSRRARAVAIVAWIFGSAAFHYGAALYGHQIVAVCLLGTVHAGWTSARPGSRRSLALAGAALGVAGLVEYQALPLCLVIGATLAVIRLRARDPLGVVALAAGALPFAAVLLAYHAAAFGGPFALSYDHLASAEVQRHHTRGVGGVGWPTGEAVHGALLSLHRGLLATSPCVVLAGWGIARLVRRERALGVAVALVVALGLLTIFGADVWYAGWSYGPRLLVGVMGLMAIGAALAIDALLDAPRGRAIGAGLVVGLVAVGLISNLLVTAVFPELPEDAHHPWKDVVAPMLAAGTVSPNLVSATLGVSGVASLTPLGAALLGLLGLVASLACRGLASARERVAAGVVAAAVIAGFVGWAAAAPASWDADQSARWERLVAHWERVEARP